jgi:hypothetical protein
MSKDSIYRFEEPFSLIFEVLLYTGPLPFMDLFYRFLGMRVKGMIIVSAF